MFDLHVFIPAASGGFTAPATVPFKVSQKLTSPPPASVDVTGLPGESPAMVFPMGEAAEEFIVSDDGEALTLAYEAGDYVHEVHFPSYGRGSVGRVTFEAAK